MKTHVTQLKIIGLVLLALGLIGCARAPAKKEKLPILLFWHDSIGEQGLVFEVYSECDRYLVLTAEIYRKDGSKLGTIPIPLTAYGKAKVSHSQLMETMGLDWRLERGDQVLIGHDGYETQSMTFE